MDLIIIPTAHVSKASAEKVRSVILREQPDIIAVELCPDRFRALIEGTRPTLRQMLGSPLYTILFLLQQALGALFGSKPGAEMKEAIRAAAELKKPILLADASIHMTMRKISAIPLKEKVGILLQVFTVPFSKLKKPGRLDDLTNPSFLEPILSDFKASFPTTYKYLVDDRNEHMVSSLLNFPDKKIVLVVGAGHAAGVAELAKRRSAQEAPISVVIE